MIIDREILHNLGIDLHFSTATMHWQDVKVSMKESTCTKEGTFHVKELKALQQGSFAALSLGVARRAAICSAVCLVAPDHGLAVVLIHVAFVLVLALGQIDNVSPNMFWLDRCCW